MYRVTASAIAYTILVYENSKEVWEEEWHIKKSISDDIQRKQATRHKKTKYHEEQGFPCCGKTHCALNCDT
jgi:hypothetical protein